MEVFRLARENRRYDLSGWGAHLYGGRWNLPGNALLYTAESRSLAAMESLVHLPSSALPDDMFMMRLEVPDTLSRLELTADQLPPDWQRLSQPYATAQIGTLWLQNQRSAALRVPSVVMPDEHNLLLNPKHPEFADVKLLDATPFHFDERLLKK